MNHVGVTAVRDYLSNVANETELAEFAQLIARRNTVLAERHAAQGNVGASDAHAASDGRAGIGEPTR